MLLTASQGPSWLVLVLKVGPTCCCQSVDVRGAAIIQAALIPPLLPRSPSSVDLRRASRKHPQQTIVLREPVVTEVELNQMVAKEKIPAKSTAWAPRYEVVPKPRRFRSL